MGANEWKHAGSLDAMSNTHLAFRLSSPVGAGGVYQLSRSEISGTAPVVQTMDLADLSDVDRVSSNAIIHQSLDTWNSVVFVSDPLTSPTELSGLFSGRLEFVTNKHDSDFNVSLYEITSARDYVALSYYMARASYVRDRSNRQLLVPGKREKLDFTSGRMTSRKFPVGGRLIVEIAIIKQPGAQINYGTGKDVSDETIADAGDPLTIRWLGSSIINVPLWRK